MGFEIVEYNVCIMALAGPPFSGKTTLGKELSRRTNLNFFDVDENGVNLEELLQSEIKHPFVTSMGMAVKYAYNQYLAGLHLAEGKPVIVAATYSHETYLYMLRTILADTYRRMYKLPDSPLRIFNLYVSEEDLASRIAKRAEQGSNSTVNTLEHTIDLRRRFVPIEGDDVTQIDTGLSVEENIAQILAELKDFRKNPTV